jgi:hypothetical protein
VLIAVTGVLLGRNTASGAPVLLPDECPAAYSLRGSVRGLSGGARATLFCHFRDLANTLVLHFSVDEAIIERRTSGRSVRLAAARLPRVRGGVLDFTLKRRPWRISLIVAGETLAEAFDSELSGGYAGYQTTGGAQVELHLQTVEPVYFTDDFARSPGEAGAWQPLSGEWRVSAVEAGRHGNQVARYSSNAFSLAGSASATALITTGYWFWDDYLAEVSVKPEERGAVGLVPPRLFRSGKRADGLHRRPSGVSRCVCRLRTGEGRSLRRAVCPRRVRRCPGDRCRRLSERFSAKRGQ